MPGFIDKPCTRSTPPPPPPPARGGDAALRDHRSIADVQEWVRKDAHAGAEQRIWTIEDVPTRLRREVPTRHEPSAAPIIPVVVFAYAFL